jgi:KDO2-lipid IV(A) lauroyltransferase
MTRDPLRVRLTGLAYLGVWRLARALPEGAAMRLFHAASMRTYRKNARRRALVEENLRPVVGEGSVLDAAVREAFALYGRYWMETFRLQDLSDGELDRRMSGRGLERLEEAHRSGGAVLAVPHLGNWDAGGWWVARRWGLTVVVEVLRPRALFDRFVKHRRSLGMTIIPLVKGGDATRACVEALSQGCLLALVSDRDLSGSGVEVKMFGRRTKLPAGPAVLALRAGKPLIPGAVYQEPDGRWSITVGEPIFDGKGTETPEEVARLTQRLAEAFETLIARAPPQWHAFGRYWID